MKKATIFQVYPIPIWYSENNRYFNVILKYKIYTAKIAYSRMWKVFQAQILRDILQTQYLYKDFGRTLFLTLCQQILNNTQQKKPITGRGKPLMLSIINNLSQNTTLYFFQIFQVYTYINIPLKRYYSIYILWKYALTLNIWNIHIYCSHSSMG